MNAKQRNRLKKVKWLFGKEIEIPEEWEICTLGSVCNEIYRYPTYFDISYVKRGTPEIRGELILSSGMLEKDMTKYRFISAQTASRFPRTSLLENDFVFSVRGTMGKIARIPKSFEGSNITANLMRISPNQKKIFPKFLFFVFFSEIFQKRLESLSPQTTIKTIQSNALKSIQFASPKFISEQQKIASILSGVDATIGNTQKIIEKYERLKKGLMQQLLTRGIGHTKFKKTVLGKIAEIASGEFLPTKEHNSGNVPIYGGNGITGYHNKELIKKSTVIFGRVGAYCGSVHFSNNKSWITDNAMFIRNLSNQITIDYLYLFLSRLNINLLAEVSAQPKITQGILNNIKIYFPTDMQEQQKIASILSGVDAYIQKNQEYKKKLERLKKGLMQKLLTGQIRVTV